MTRKPPMEPVVCADCGRLASGEDELCDGCAFIRDQNDYMESTGRNLEGAARGFGRSIVHAPWSTDYRRGEDQWPAD